MALSLAACGGSSTTAVVEETTPVITQAELDAANAAAAAAAAAQAAAEAELAAAVAVNTAPNSLTLGTTQDLATGDKLGAGNDTISGTQATYTGNDVIVDASSSDSDTLTVAANASITATPTVAGIEAINFNMTTFAEPSVAIDNITGGTVTVSQAQAGGSTNATVTGAGGTTVAAGTGVSGTLTVTQTAATSLDIDGGAAATVTHTNATTGSVNIVGGASTTSASGVATTGSVSISGAALGTGTATGATTNVTLTKAGTTTTATTAAVTGTTGTSDVANVSAVGLVTLTNNGNIETVNLSGNGAAVTYTAAAGAGTAFVLNGDQDVTVKMTTAIANGETVTDSTTAGTTTVQVTDGGALNTAKINADVIKLDVITAAADITAKSGQTFSVANDTDRMDLVSSSAAGATGDSITINALGANLVLGGGTAGAGAATDVFSTVNVDASTAANTLNATLGTATDLNISGSKAVTVAATATAKSVTSTNTAGITVILDGTNDIATITGGSGVDTIRHDTDAQSIAAVTFTGIDVIALDAADADDDLTLTVNSSQISGKAIAVTGTEGTAATDEDVLNIAVNASSVDASTLVVDAANVDVVFDLTSVAATATNITGTNSQDSLSNQGAGAITFDGKGGVDAITGGSGADILTGGEGADTITGAAGNDTIILTETTSAIDTVVFNAEATNGKDTIQGFTSGKDKLDVNAIVTTTSNAVTSGSHTAANAVTENAYVISSGGTSLVSGGSKTITDYANLTQVSAYVDEGFNAVSGATSLYVISDGTNEHMYAHTNAADTTYEVSEFTYVGIVENADVLSTDLTV